MLKKNIQMKNPINYLNLHKKSIPGGESDELWDH